MTRERCEHSIEKPCEVTGRGYWSGQRITVRFLPAPALTGIRFIRTDLPAQPEIPASIDLRQTMSLRTVLTADSGASVSMVEHLLAALYGLQIDNCIVEVNAEEMPGLDGSAGDFVTALQTAGRFEQASVQRPLVVDRVIRIGTAAEWIEASPSSSGQLEVEYHLDYGECPIPPQSCSCEVSIEHFIDELANARTFVTDQQAKQLLAQGVASHVTSKDLLVFDETGVVDNTLRFENECARHKALDMVGDLSLAGMPVIGRFESYRGGHELNASMAMKLVELSQRTGRDYQTVA